MMKEKLPKQCSDTKQDSNPVKTERHGDKRIYESRVKEGGILKLIINIPSSKLVKKVRDMFFRRARR